MNSALITWVKLAQWEPHLSCPRYADFNAWPEIALQFMTSLDSYTSCLVDVVTPSWYICLSRQDSCNIHIHDEWKFIMVFALNFYNRDGFRNCFVLSFADCGGDNTCCYKLQKTNIYSNGHVAKGFKVSWSYDYWYLACRFHQFTYAIRCVVLTFTVKPRLDALGPTPRGPTLPWRSQHFGINFINIAADFYISVLYLPICEYPYPYAFFVSCYKYAMIDC
jgi:hypothetical protein